MHAASDAFYFVGHATITPIDNLELTWTKSGELTNSPWLRPFVQFAATAFSLLTTAAVYAGIATLATPFVITVIAPAIVGAAPIWLVPTLQAIGLAAAASTAFVGSLLPAISLAPTLALEVFGLTAALVSCNRRQRNERFIQASRRLDV